MSTEKMTFFVIFFSQIAITLDFFQELGRLIL